MLRVRSPCRLCGEVARPTGCFYVFIFIFISFQVGHSAWEGGRRGGAQGGGWQCHGGGFFSLRSNFQPGINSLTARCRRSGCLSCWPGEPTKLGWVWESQIQVCALPASKPRRCPRCPSCHWRGFDALRAAEKAHV